MTILLTGASGQIGHELARSLQCLGPLHAPGRDRLDLADHAQIDRVVRALRPSVIVNAAAFTEVDRAESAPALAWRLNAEAPAALAQAARAVGAAMVHYSTDYVFDGTKAGPWDETDAPAPLNVYGASKLAGEQAVAAAGIEHLILRTSWLYGLRGRNFLLTILRLAAAQERLPVVADRFGTPTWSRTVAEATALLLAQARAGGPAWWQQHGGVCHLACSGRTSWHGFAQAIVAHAGLACDVVPVAARDYPAPAVRPVNSQLATTRAQALLHLPDWQAALALCMQDWPGRPAR